MFGVKYALVMTILSCINIFNLKVVNKNQKVCLDVRGASYGQPIGVSGCHHQLGNQVILNYFESLPILLSNLFS